MSALWNEVDVVLEVYRMDIVKKTFKTLRDRFVRLLDEESKSKRSGSAASNTVEWKYFSQLEFLRPSVEYRPTINSLSKSSLSKSKRSIDIDTSGSNSSALKKKNKNVQPAESVREDFESFCKKNIDPTVPARIGSFILYLESEMRVLSNQAMRKLIRKITESLMQVQDESAT
ncbi:uncharacterized protein [Temnothorax longispinosus]|uniref:Transcription factor adf-1-like protein n=1 Tax=Temnothorax longispinosus TaxID=300112 RepID=A0A4S2KD21_9HYME|nr:Transcription factor adf-1-like protein [Temnothorax longispinosus]